MNINMNTSWWWY